MEVAKSGKSRTWLTTCPKCSSSIKYSKLDVTKKESRSPVSSLLSSKLNVDVIYCPVCKNEITVYFQNECTEE